MEKLIITGGRKLLGNIKVHGAKNSILPILAATILNKGECIIHNCPSLRDVDSAISILRYLGCTVDLDGNTITVNSKNLSNTEIPNGLMREMRSSVIFLGAIIARTGQAKLTFPGGCELGPRPIDLHIKALEELGADIYSEGSKIVCNSSKLRGTDINLDFPSVGATENIMIAACLAKGKTRIINAAREPEIIDLANFLMKMGARIYNAGTSVIEIHGVEKLDHVEYTVAGDRIVAGTYLAAAAITGGEIYISGVLTEYLQSEIGVFRSMGCKVYEYNDIIKLEADEPLRAPNLIRTMPYPGFPTDAQPQIMAVSTVAQGSTVFVENIFAKRYRHIDELMKMGADISVEGRVALVNGVGSLKSAKVIAPDLRGGAALVVAALAAEGVTEISGVVHIDRGYENIEKDIVSLGGIIERK